MGKWTGEEMKKYKKAFTIGIIFVLSLLICFGIGQKIVLPRTEGKRQIQEKNSGRDLEINTRFVGQFEFFTLTGYQKTKNNPWEKTIGKFQMEDIGDCILMTPNTGIDLPILLLDQGELAFEVRIHPWVSADSDGAGLLIKAYDDEGIALEEYNIDINNSDDFKLVTIDFKSRDNISTINIRANNGKKDDDTCDWIIIKDVI